MAEDFASAVGWIGYCGRCGDPSPEVRDNEAAALRDAADCPCKADADEAQEQQGAATDEMPQWIDPESLPIQGGGVMGRPRPTAQERHHA